MVEQGRSYLGMTHNPFASPGEGFFERGDRKTHLEQLRHLSQWSRRVLLVTGPHDSGKSIMYRQLSASLEPRAKAARVNGTLINTSRELLAAIAQGYGIAAPSDANTQLLTKLVAEHVEEQESSDRFCVTLIDDAEIIEPAALDGLLELVAQCPMRLVLFGEARFVPLVERLAKRHEVGWHEIRLTGFSAQDAREYLEWRFQQAKYRGRLPFTDQQVKDVVRLSEGLPGKINQMANVLMIKLESGDVAERARFPALHRALLALVLVVVAFAYLLWQQQEEAVPAPEPAATAAAAHGTDVEIESAEEATAVVDSSVAAASAEVDDLAIEDPTTQRLDVPEIVPVTGLQPQITLEPGAETGPGPMVEASVPDEEKARESVGSSRDGRWLRGQSADAFTIQLMSLSSAESVQAYLGNQSEAERFATYRLQRDGRVLHVVVFGMFDTRVEAQTAAANLPGSVGNVRPWVRPMGQVHAAMGSTLQP